MLVVSDHERHLSQNMAANGRNLNCLQKKNGMRDIQNRIGAKFWVATFYAGVHQNIWRSLSMYAELCRSFWCNLSIYVKVRQKCSGQLSNYAEVLDKSRRFFLSGPYILGFLLGLSDMEAHATSIERRLVMNGSQLWQTNCMVGITSWSRLYYHFKFCKKGNVQGCQVGVGVTQSHGKRPGVGVRVRVGSSHLDSTLEHLLVFLT